MTLSELTAYAEEKFYIREEQKWDDFPGFSVLSDPVSGKWVALLMRQWNYETGEWIERCDLRCGRQSLAQYPYPFLSLPFRMKGKNWIGVRFTEQTQAEVIFRLMDRAAVYESGGQGALIVLGEAGTDSRPVNEGRSASPPLSVYQDSRIPPSAASLSREYRGVPGRDRDTQNIPEKIRQMKKLYEYGSSSFRQKCMNFYRQGIFMRDYEDSFVWDGDFRQYFPTYHDLTVEQLRGYFTWRTFLRKGEYRHAPESFAYLYLYELINGIGTDGAEDSLQKMRRFEEGYLDSGIGETSIRINLRRWMLDLAIVYGLPEQTAREAADPELLARDRALTVLHSPMEYPEEEIFEALSYFGGARWKSSPSFAAAENSDGRRLCARMWQTACAGFMDSRGMDLFTALFGRLRRFPWHPLSNALCRRQMDREEQDTVYVLDTCRRYLRISGIWQEERYEPLYFDKQMLRAFLHAADLKLRRFLKTGHYLREKTGEEWVTPFADLVLEEEQQRLAEAARAEIRIDLSGLEKIRREADQTRDSLLTELEIEPEDMYSEVQQNARQTEEPENIPPLSELQRYILRMLLDGKHPEERIRSEHLMPSIAADDLNEALFDEIGDSVIFCEDDELRLVEEYTEDLAWILDGQDK